MTPSFLRRTAAGLVLACAAIVSAHAADAPKISDAERAKIEAIVHDYLMNNPQVVLESVQAYQEKIEAEKEATAKAAIAARKSDLLNDPDNQVLGNKTSDCVVVEFFDNQCPYCQLNEPELEKLLKEDARIKLVLKEYPILGPVSTVASQAALASVKQGKYEAFHKALLTHKGHYDSDKVVFDIAKDVGLDLDKLRQDMKAAEIQKQIARNLDLGKALAIKGTPGFVIGDQIVAGASSMEELKQYVAAACPAG